MIRAALYPVIRQAGRFVLIAAGLAPALSAWEYGGATWPSGDIVIDLHVDGAGAPVIATTLNDGSSSWRQVALASMGEWNAHMERAQLIEGPAAATPNYGNGSNEILFSDSVYGEPFGETVLGVTLTRLDSNAPHLRAESDIVINTSNELWNSYRGTLRLAVTDVRRVLTHELGHLLGLNHPDEADPPQTVAAIMNSRVSNTDLLQADDKEGITALYGGDFVTHTITRGLVSRTVNVGDLVTFDFELDGAAPPREDSESTLTYYWFYPELDLENWLFTFREPKLFIGAAQPYDSGTYTVMVATPFDALFSEATLTVNPVEIAPATRMANLSTRAYAGIGAQTLTVGFVIRGDAPKRVLVRAVGPTLAAAPFGLAGAHPNPRLKLTRSDGAEIATNDNWQTNTTADAAEIARITNEVGGFTLLPDSQDAVLLLELEPGIYTAQVDGPAGEEGIVIVEAYDVDGPETGSRLVNLSTRGHVGAGANIMIAGLVVDGPGPRTYLVRAVGDTLGDFGISEYLDDTVLTVFQGATVIREVDDWDDPAAHQPMLAAAMEQLGAFALTDRQESALKITLNPGAYTLQIKGFDDQVGVSLVEVYEFPEN